jgi:hypothetical protein
MMILNQLQHYITISIRINHQQWGHNQQPILRDGNHQSISMEIKNNNFLLATMGTLCFRLVVFSSAGALADCSFQKV